MKLAPPLDHVAVVVDPAGALVSRWRPDVVVDARLLKRPGATSVTAAPFVVSLGPGAVCGQDAHVVIETQRGHDSGAHPLVSRRVWHAPRRARPWPLAAQRVCLRMVPIRNAAESRLACLRIHAVGLPRRSLELDVSQDRVRI